MLLQTQMPASCHQSLPQPSGTAQCRASRHPAANHKAAKRQEGEVEKIDAKHCKCLNPEVSTIIV